MEGTKNLLKTWLWVPEQFCLRPPCLTLIVHKSTWGVIGEYTYVREERCSPRSSLRGGRNISVDRPRVSQMGTEILNVMLNLNKLSRKLYLSLRTAPQYWPASISRLNSF